MPEPSILERLIDRKLVQYAVACIAAAWVIAQVAEVAAEPWDLPLGWIRVLDVLLVAGFPIVVILAWFHGDRGHQRVTRSEVALLASVVAGSSGVRATSGKPALPEHGGSA